MKYFRRIKHNIDVQPFLDEIASIPDAWDLSTGRQDKIAVQREAQAIPLRGLVKSKIGDRKRRDVHESRYTTSSRKFLVARAFLESFAAEQDTELGRGKIVRLMPGRRVYPHIDRGEYYLVRDRYHLILQSQAGSYLKAGDEEVRMREGELWWFDNNAMHEAHNDGDVERIHMIFDMLPRHRIAAVYGSDAHGTDREDKAA
jgi:hypothetical protein